MARIAVIAPPLAGHLDPLGALGAALVRRGHRVSFVGMADAAPMVAGGCGFEAVGVGSHPPGTLATMVRHIGALRGVWGIGRVLGDLAGVTEMLCNEAPGVLRRIGAELIVADQTEAAGGLIARHLGLPCVSVACALPINEEAGVPPPFTGWRYDASVAGRRRNAGGYWVSRALSRPLNRVIGRRAQAWGLAGVGSLADCLSERWQISQMVGALDFPRAALPPGFAYVGPLRGPERGEVPGLPAAAFAFATLGTLQGSRAGLFGAIAEACRRRGLGCVIAHGGRLSDGEAGALPGSPVVRAWVNQRAVLRRAAVAMTHGGLNTVLDALAAGVPLVVVPLAFEQAAIGARVAYHGAGIVVPARRDGAAMAAAVEAALLAIATDPAYGRRAAALAQAIAASGGAGAAADIIDGALRDPMLGRTE